MKLSKENTKKLHTYVKKICGSMVSMHEADPKNYPEETGIKDVPSSDTWYWAKVILRLIGVDENSKIYEIPVCWDGEVCIRFYLGSSYVEDSKKTIYNLFLTVSEKTNILYLALVAEDEYGDPNYLIKLDASID